MLEICLKIQKIGKKLDKANANKLGEAKEGSYIYNVNIKKHDYGKVQSNTRSHSG
jgi:hypothetical protein